MEARSGKEGRREYIQVLRLCERFEQSQAEWAMARALDMGAISCDAVKMIALARPRRRPPHLDLQLYPHLPRADVERTDPGAYMGLLSPTDASATGVPV